MAYLQKAVALLISVLMTVFAGTSAKEYEGEYKNDYPIIFVHGLNGWGEDEDINDAIPYWGATTGDLVGYLGSEGYECYAASVGPISSAWDRVCELYAQLTGTTVDYGQAHSEKYSHARYGRTYDTPLIENWSNVDKVNLVGHSFGGPTVRLMVQLLSKGSAEEKEATTDGTLSPLFKGGKSGWVNSVTTICAPHNGTTFYNFGIETGLYWPVLLGSVSYSALAGRTSLNGGFVDFHLEQFGLTNTPGEEDADGYIESVVNFMKNNEDSAQYDLTMEGAAKLNEQIDISPNVYYYSYAYDTTATSEKFEFRYPKLGTDVFLYIFSTYMCFDYGFTDESTGIEIDESWRANDGLVNTVSESYPFDEPHEDYSETSEPERGIWYVMPVLEGDHGTAVGVFANREETQATYLTMAEMISKLK